MRQGREAAEMGRVSTTVSTDMKKGLGFCFFGGYLQFGSMCSQSR